jgi:hypothetical protein
LEPSGGGFEVAAGFQEPFQENLTMSKNFLFACAALAALASVSARAEYDPKEDPCLVNAEQMAKDSVAEEVKVPGHNSDLDRIAYYGAHYQDVNSRDWDPAEERKYVDLNDGKHYVDVDMDCMPGYGWGCHGYVKSFRITKYTYAGWFTPATCELVEE